MRVPLTVVIIFGLLRAMPAGAAPTFSVSDAVLPTPLVIVAYGDMRFTDPHEKDATSPGARRALVAKVAAEQPAAVFVNGDIPWHGIAADYAEFTRETRSWRAGRLRIYPALGNHEFQACAGEACLDHWWHTFPTLQGRRWYSVGLGSKVLAVVLDSDTSLLPGSEQRVWVEDQLGALTAAVRLVLVVIHHPPVADLQVSNADHNPRPNETTLVPLLEDVAHKSSARVVVSAGHIHNYERLMQDDVTYLVSGGGGAKPYAVDRTADDLYRSTDFPNYHYVRLELNNQKLRAEMVRLEDFDAVRPKRWKIRDRFEVSLLP